jgi:hypothetical protein
MTDGPENRLVMVQGKGFRGILPRGRWAELQDA